MPKISLKAARVNAELTRREMSEKMGVSSKTIENWESGRCTISLANILLFASICGLSSNDISLPKKSPKRGI